MGQQQLLLIVLVSIIVTIATIVAINTFQATRVTSNIDAIRQQIFTAHNYSIAHYNRPAGLGGGGGSFSGLTMQSINLPDSTADGKYVLEIDSGNAQEFKIIATPTVESPPITFTLTPTSVTSDID
ncbi:MAG: hypothetical protein JJU41_08845 [Bacteroidetes bacterium]|nr:hypothetical protein [Bacteroidota bacterium]